MDRASILRDAATYIKGLQEQERLLRAEIEELESDTVPKENGSFQFHDERDLPIRSGHSPIEVLDLSVTFMGGKTMVVSLNCTKRRETMVELYEVFETMKLKVITDSLIEVSGTLTRTLLIEAEEEDKDDIKLQIETAIEDFNVAQC